MLISGVQKFSILDFPKKTSCIVFTAGCNFRCGFCYNPEFVIPEQIAKIRNSFIPEETFYSFLDQRKGLLDGVVITGGEPTIMPDLPKFMAKIREMGFAVKLDTNGNNPTMLKDVIDKRLINYVAMDIKTSLENYPQVSGLGARPERVKQSIELIRDSKVPYEFRSTLIKEIHSEDTLNKMAQLLEGAEQLFLQYYRLEETIDPKYQNYKAFSEEEMQKIATNIFAPHVKQVVVR